MFSNGGWQCCPSERTHYCSNVMKKLTLEGAQKKLWTTVSEYIRRRDLGRCFTCGVIKPWKKTQAGHYIHGSENSKYSPLHFNEYNVHCQCVHCNKWLHGNTTEYAYRLKKKYGARILDVLQKLKMQPKRLTVEEMVELNNYWKERLKDLPL